MSNILDLAKKMQRLAEQGVGGEKENALTMLRRLMSRNGISESDLAQTQRSYRLFPVESVDEARIISQVMSTILPVGFERKGHKDHKLAYVVEVTDLEFLEIRAKHDFYWRAYKRELELFVMAFIQKHGLVPPPSLAGVDAMPMSAEETAKVRGMMRNMDSHTYHKQIG
ncbi:DUF2786 domain-containing protein [Hymenobacter guriensis]|uniref:DUF2786 domain-containing protein n=1 Tax=Hymenobacter guriensis TaxID=2793065 RepID=A0ABS0KWU7_9BACT|nr:DUF2786 domain-containing protein [Hymenobacter guriensis]MBG8552342.1 DUF2786 domain-containing protein [Hymenobacter guriensis]